MKKIALILFAVLIAFPLFADECSDALEESNQLLLQAYERIEDLEDENERLRSGSEIERLTKENKSLSAQILSYEVVIAESSLALEESNDILSQAYDRIDADGVEISGLRTHVDNLISAGVEIKTYDWNVIITSGYPVSLGVMVGYNLPFFTSLGVVAGFDYNFANNIPEFKAGLKINIGKD